MLILNRIPTRPMSQLYGHMNEMLNSVFSDSGCCFPAATVTPSVPMNVWEESEKFRIEAELPGYEMKDIEITVQGDEVTVKGQRTLAEQPNAKFLRRERTAGAFSRTWALPVEIEADAVEATLHDGVLLITLPKSKQAMPVKIAVKSLSK